MKKRAGLREVLLLAASMLVAVLIAEAVAHLFVPVTPRLLTTFDLKTSDYYEEDDEVGWVPRKGIHGEHVQDGSFSSSFSTNSLGLRDEEPGAGAESRPIRIVALGDSFTWGWGVDDNEIYTHVIEELAPSVDVVNLGVTAFGLRQEMAYFDRLGRPMNPDIILVALVMNDVSDPGRPRPGETAPEWRGRLVALAASDSLAGAAGSGFGALKPWLADHSILYRATRDVVNTNRTLVHFLAAVGLKGQPAGLEGLDPNLHAFLRSYPDEVRSAVDETERELIELRDKASEANARLLVVVVPALQSIDGRARRNSIAYTRFYERDFDLNKPYRWLSEFGESNGIEVLNTVDAFRAAEGEGAVLYLTADMHFNVEGHRLFANEIVRYMTGEAWIP